MTLSDWLNNRWLQSSSISETEVVTRLEAVDENLAASQIPGQPIDWKFQIAYTAALKLAALALALEGYKPVKDMHHYRAIHSLRFTLGIDADIIRRFEHFRTKRNRIEYEESGVVSKLEADDMLQIAQDLKVRVESKRARSK
jgi:hypothetical protein